MPRITFDQQKLEFWITGFFTRAKLLWHRFVVGEEDFGVEMISCEKHRSQSSHSSSNGLKGRLNIGPVSSTILERFDGGSVALDHFIYTVGGYDPCELKRGYDRIPSRYIYCLDTTNLDEGWKKLDAEMKMGRQHPQLAALEGKIYFFGGAVRRDSQPPSEVYDSVTERIDVLPEEKDEYTYDLHLVGVDHVLNRIVFCSIYMQTRKFFCNSKTKYSYLVFYYPETQKWAKEGTHESVADHLHELLSCTHVVVGTTIYWLSKNFEIKAYDFDQRRFSSSGELKFHAKEGHPGWSDDSFVCSYLLHMNGDCFCLFWDDDQYSSEDSAIHCTELKISNCITKNKLLSVSVLGMRTYTIPGCGFTVTDVLPMYGKHDTPPRTITTDATPVDDVSTVTINLEYKPDIRFPLYLSSGMAELVKGVRLNRVEVFFGLKSLNLDSDFFLLLSCLVRLNCLETLQISRCSALTEISADSKYRKHGTPMPESAGRRGKELSCFDQTEVAVSHTKRPQGVAIFAKYGNHSMKLWLSLSSGRAELLEKLHEFFDLLRSLPDNQTIEMIIDFEELGRQIVCEENMTERGEYSRLWSSEEDALDLWERHGNHKGSSPQPWLKLYPSSRRMILCNYEI